MKQTTTKKDFILKSLLHYFEDRSKCGYEVEMNICKYLVLNGNKCALGQWIKDEEYKPEMERESAYSLIKNYGEKILVDEAQDIFTLEEWSALQVVHDSLAASSNSLLFFIQKLEKTTNTLLPELHEAFKKLS